MAAAVALGALLLAPAPAHAQYTLTFGSTNKDKSIGSPYTGNGSVEAPSTEVTITDGYASAFGQSSFTSNTAGAACATGLCYQEIAPGNEGARFHAPSGSAGVGEFVFTPVGSNTTSLTSFVIGSTADNHAAEVRIYALDGTTLLATYTDNSLGKKNTQNTVLITDFTFASGKAASDLAFGFRFEWGTDANASGTGDQLYIDNLIFKSEIAPEPSAMLLVGTGLLVMVPLSSRRRRRKG